MMSEWAEKSCAAVDSNDCPQSLSLASDGEYGIVHFDAAGDRYYSLEAIANRLECQKIGAGWLFMDVLGLLDGERSFLEILTPMQVFRYCSGWCWQGATSNEKLYECLDIDEDEEIEKGPDDLLGSIPGYLSRYLLTRFRQRSLEPHELLRRVRRFKAAIDEAFPGMSKELERLCELQQDLSPLKRRIDYAQAEHRSRYEPNFVWLWSLDDQFEEYYDDVHELKMGSDNCDGNTIWAVLGGDSDAEEVLDAIELTTKQIAALLKLTVISEVKNEN